MEWLNYHHLHYFWVVAREGGLGPASEALKLSKPTLSGQIHALEEALGVALFERQGRGLALTEVGREVFRHATEIFTRGEALLDVVRGRAQHTLDHLRVGVTEAVPKLIVRRLLAPALAEEGGVRVVCTEDDAGRLFAQLASHELDLVLSDAPVAEGTVVKVFHHTLGECGVTLFGAARFAGLKKGFPASLAGAPMLLPLEGSPQRRAINHWLDAHGLKVKVVAECEDSALLKTLGAEGIGVFAAPSAVEREVVRQYKVVALGRASKLKERFYAITTERRLKNPYVLAITSRARLVLFARPPRPGRAGGDPAAT